MVKGLIKTKNMPSFINVKLRLYLNEEQSNILDGHSRICNFLYNLLLEKANNLKEEYKKTLDSDIAKILYTKYGLRDLIPGIKNNHKFLNVVYSSCLKNAALRLTSVIQDYQKSKKGRRKGKHTDLGLGSGR